MEGRTAAHSLQEPTMPRHRSFPPVTPQLVELVEASRTKRISVDAHTAAAYGAGSHKFARLGDLDLLTDSHADCLRTARDGEEPAAILQARDFSLNSYDLSTVRGRAQVREYLRRKLTFLQGAFERDAEAYLRHLATIAARGVQA
jgi:hypothetical protein